MITAKIDLVSGWGEEMARRIERQARDAMLMAAEEGARVASRAAAPRRRTGLMAQMDVLPVVATRRGYSSGFRSRAYYAGFQSRGTMGKRRGKVKPETLRRRRGSGAGITPLMFLEKGRAAMRRAVVSRLNQITDERR